MRIDFLHGIVDHWVADSSTDRLYVSRASFEGHLKRRPAAYSTWGDSEPAGDDILMVDDATRAGAEACRLARDLGHEVIFFINPYQVVAGRPYFFSVLDVFIEERSASSVTYCGRSYDLTQRTGVRELRKAVKVDLMHRSAPEAEADVATLGGLLGVTSVSLPAHLHPVSANELRGLRQRGVRIENHGWSHVEIRNMDDIQFREHIELGRRWLREELDVESRLYAVPFGLTELTAAQESIVAASYFLGNPDLPRGRIGTHCWNRYDITATLQR
jgi:hypothetical protein